MSTIPVLVPTPKPDVINTQVIDNILILIRQIKQTPIDRGPVTEPKTDQIGMLLLAGLEISCIIITDPAIQSIYQRTKQSVILSEIGTKAPLGTKTKAMLTECYRELDVILNKAKMQDKKQQNGIQGLFTEEVINLLRDLNDQLFALIRGEDRGLKESGLKDIITDQVMGI
ncbi:hypothetical protein BDV25DRAFT_135096 [Aspergillus avenaceus]|uniref:Uncharacterized protein n=1 Tax=Aspergillus avenaceus TaxID=36643 RepID=A0A5N6U9S6_ASPAV|nr:hypothetical protein BDV25DRAFT_135096 [Aspergillus avenaceus]